MVFEAFWSGAVRLGAVPQRTAAVLLPQLAVSLMAMSLAALERPQTEAEKL